MNQAVAAGFLLGLALVFSVGPVIFTILKLRINYGKIAAYYFIAGVWFSDLVWVVTANFFGSLLADLTTYKKEIGFVGGLFLIGLGIYYAFIKKYKTKAELAQDVKISNTTHARLFATGFFMNTLNPGVIALWLAAATNVHANNFTLEQKIMVFAVCLGMNMVADVLKINLAGKISQRLNDKTIVFVSKLSGGIYILFGLLLIIGSFYSGTPASH